MLILVNKYGSSHVCALPEFKNIGIHLLTNSYNFPYLDIYFPSKDTIEFYYRGTKDLNLKFKNLFEYLVLSALNG